MPPSLSPRDPRRILAEIEEAARRDPRGHVAHLAAALFFALCLTGPTSVTELGGVPLMVMLILRLHVIWRPLGLLLAQPVAWVGLAAIAWQALSLLWTPDARLGLDELSAARWTWAVAALWPMLMHRRAIVLAILAGALVGNAVQLVNALGNHLDVPWLHWFHRMPGRESGWWDPVAGGSMLVGVLGLWLPAAFLGPGLIRLPAAVGAVVTLLGVFATGSRGPWLAAAALVALAALAALVLAPARRAPTERPSRTPLLVGVALLALGAALLGLTQRGLIESRLAAARADLAAAAEGNYATDTGARLLMARLALDATREHPLRGVGAGGYQRWSLDHLAQTQPAAPPAPIHPHAHSAPLHIAATTGLVGLALAGAFFALALARGVRTTPHASPDTRPFDLAPALGVAGLLLAGLFDPVHLTAQTASLLYTLVALVLAPLLPQRPAGPVLTPPRRRLRLL